MCYIHENSNDSFNIFLVKFDMNGVAGIAYKTLVDLFNLSSSLDF